MSAPAAHARAHSFRCLRLLLLLTVAGVVLPGCVRRTLTITTEPPQALIYLNDQEVGRSEVTTDFLWYGDYDFVARKEGYQTLHTNVKLDAPWYQIIPFDFFFEVLWPGKIVDARSAHFVLDPWEPPTHEELIERGEKARRDALQIGTQFGADKPE